MIVFLIEKYKGILFNPLNCTARLNLLNNFESNKTNGYIFRNECEDIKNDILKSLSGAMLFLKTLGYRLFAKATWTLDYHCVT